MKIATASELQSHLNQLDEDGRPPLSHYILEWLGIQLISPSLEALQSYT